MSNMIRRSMDLEEVHVAPDQGGRTDKKFENIKVRLLKWPDEEVFKRLVSRGATAPIGNIIGDETIDDIVVEDAFKGGFQQMLEWDSVVFEIAGITRELTHQLVRTRKASFSQQTGRHTYFGEFNVRMPTAIVDADMPLTDVDPDIYPHLHHAVGNQCDPEYAYKAATELARDTYLWLCNEADIPYEAARSVNPVSIETYIIAKYDISVFIDTYSYRACQLMFPEHVHVMNMMKDALLEKCPWLRPHLKIMCEKTGPSADGKYEHVCKFAGWESVDGHCTFEWGKDENRAWKSRRFDK